MLPFRVNSAFIYAQSFCCVVGRPAFFLCPCKEKPIYQIEVKSPCIAFSSYKEIVQKRSGFFLALNIMTLRPTPLCKLLLAFLLEWR